MIISSVYVPDVTSGFRAFSPEAAIPFVAGVVLGFRFLYYFFFTSQRSGHIQSLIFCAILLNLSFILFIIGVLGDLIGFSVFKIRDVRALWKSILTGFLDEIMGRACRM